MEPRPSQNRSPQVMFTWHAASRGPASRSRISDLERSFTPWCGMTPLIIVSHETLSHIFVFAQLLPLSSDLRLTFSFPPGNRRLPALPLDLQFKLIYPLRLIKEPTFCPHKICLIRRTQPKQTKKKCMKRINPDLGNGILHFVKIWIFRQLNATLPHGCYLIGMNLKACGGQVVHILPLIGISLIFTSKRPWISSASKHLTLISFRNVALTKRRLGLYEPS